MNKNDFISELRDKLLCVPYEEREAAIRYYEEFFDDAGVENEDSVISQLGSPEKVAQTILADVGQFSSPPPVISAKKQPIPVWAIVLIAVFAIPVGIPLLGAAFGIVVGFLGAAFGIVISIVALVLGLIISGIVLFSYGIALLFTTPLVGMATLGAGLIVTGLGILALIPTLLLFTKGIPACIRFFVLILRKLFVRKEAIQ